MKTKPASLVCCVQCALAALLAVATLTVNRLAMAGISVTSAGAGPLAFDAQPTVADGWSTLSFGTGAGTYTTAAGLDGAVNSQVAASSVITALGQSGNWPPSENAIARWNDGTVGGEKCLKTRPTENDYLVLMATLVNDAGGDVTSLTVSYSWDQRNVVPVNESVAGHRAFYSLTGAAGTWTLIPEFSNFDST
jgi:hypothetical protein